MRKLKYYVACSIDGFIAHEDGSFESFLTEGESVTDYLESLKEFDVVLMGRKTYEVGLKEGKTDPSPTMKSYVFSRTMKESPDKRVEIVSDNVGELVRNLKNETGKAIYLCGGSNLATTLFIVEAFGNNFVAIHHIGSTAISGIYAKAIIDMLVEVHDITKVDEQSSAIASLGYEVMGEFGIFGRRYFRKDNQLGIRTHHLHAFAVDSPQVARHSAFRDYLIAHPEEAQRYSELKRKLAEKYPYNIDGYMDGKDSFIREIDKKWEMEIEN